MDCNIETRQHLLHQLDWELPVDMVTQNLYTQNKCKIYDSHIYAHDRL